MNGAGMFEIMAITKALSDRNRVRLLAAMEDHKLCVCQLVELVGLAPSTVSKHLSILRSARLIESRKEGRWIHYGLASSGASKTINQAIEWLLASARELPLIRDDRMRLEQILKIETEILCRRQELNKRKIK
jgi:DNA-binding transcriptional ArsR family regulator